MSRTLYGAATLILGLSCAPFQMSAQSPNSVKEVPVLPDTLVLHHFLRKFAALQQHDLTKTTDYGETFLARNVKIKKADVPATLAFLQRQINALQELDRRAEAAHALPRSKAEEELSRLSQAQNAQLCSALKSLRVDLSPEAAQAFRQYIDTTGRSGLKGYGH